MKADIREDETLIYAPPDSSSSDDDNREPTQSAHKQSTRKTLKPSSPSTKRIASTAASTRPKRLKLTNNPTLDTLKPLKDSTCTDPFPAWDSSGSQKIKPHKSYANRRFFQKLEPVESMPRPRAEGERFVSYAKVEKQEEKASKTTFIHVADLPLPGIVRKHKAGHKMTIPRLLGETPEPKKADFRLPEIPDFSSSGDAENPVAFDVDSPRSEGRRRSGSTSSLSSVDDMFLLMHNDEFKIEPDPALSGICCPVCRKTVRDSISLLVPDNLRTMPFQQQQKFCAQHRLADARGQWEERGYPKLDWEKLETFRIPKKTQELKRVISRQRSCYYLDELDAKIKAAKGNRRAIRNYLNEGLIDIAKPGYYGPKGARIMVHAITESLSKTLNKALQSDSALRTAGVGAYVSAVLVPELTLQLVMEDMKLPTAKEGRKVLDESTDIGVLLNPDDDHVEREHDGEND
ncbi:uncharacterized protein A1O5_02589 [Cladophialophora psammophila CBS 110553]|uniref:Restriction of telomere capping protein 4 n=1 Tax=Cladophialophora psammophila CBS 110553 TaxID=1182543 RepID=W9X279_9EURO|nr:uncharacterized protein A1O5_02589 [Cladophialophora psammophila CBS 110553]EXJ74293.1 hypothetical protein A1O5_02589 [Cladophialophora psammophila CBS 110553]